MSAKALAGALLLASVAALGEPPAALRDLSFLLGAWDAVSGPPGSSGATTFRRDVQDRVIVRVNHAEYPASQARPAATHDDLMIVYVGDDSRVRADYYDNEGHVIRSVIDKDRLAGEFAMAKPDAPEAFAPMFKWELARWR